MWKKVELKIVLVEYMEKIQTSGILRLLVFDNIQVSESKYLMRILSFEKVYIREEYPDLIKVIVFVECLGLNS